MFEARGKHAHQSLRKLLRRLVRESGKNHVFELACLFGDGRGDARMTVPVDVDPPRRNGVQNLAPVAGV